MKEETEYKELLSCVATAAKGVLVEWTGVSRDTQLPVGFTKAIVKLEDIVDELEKAWAALCEARRKAASQPSTTATGA